MLDSIKPSNPFTAGEGTGKTTKRLLYADSVRAAAIVSMVFHHATGAYVNVFEANHVWWWLANTMRSSTLAPVPLFIMLSGMLLLDPGKDESLQVFFRKRSRKVFIPFLLWVGIHFLYLVYIEDKSFSGAEAVRMVLKGPVYPHLWYIYPLIGLYIATPVLRAYVKAADTANIFYLLVVWFLAVSVLPMLEKFLNLEIGIRFVVVTGYVGYFVAGHLLRSVFMSRGQLWLAFAVFLVSLAFTVSATNHLASTGYERPNIFSNPLSPNIIIMSVSLFLLLKSFDYEQLDNKYPSLIKAIKHISSSSFGVYLVHYMILITLRSGQLGFKIHALYGTISHPVVGIGMTFLATILLSLATITIMRKIRYVRAMAP